MTAPHVPVLLAEVVAALMPRNGALYLDGTFGAGGYSRALLDAASCRVIAFDRDPAAIKTGGDLSVGYRERLTLIEGRFSEMESLLKPLGVDAVSGVVFDLGVSSMQIDDAYRGFSFRADGPLDMRMSQHGESAADLVNRLSEPELIQIIRDFGEERFARRVARAILAARKTAPITRTGELAALVRRSVPAWGTIDPATRTFQALRIAVNDELGELDRGLIAAERLLAPGGRLAVISFHSLEDRRVKSFLRVRSGHAPRGTRHLPAAREREPSFRLLTSKPVTPSTGELALNPRARSARLRAAERTAAPAWGEAA
ncbi:MAG TPA: 16S rRNA (cytosine(1402)-N(4))-methyltransferase RsmH [Stellaceae bacterium]|nr:16S rRNA (cytosine(1402)-N(4))-methyltransferase RsmH [Stellaceae bacterium]